MANFYAKYPPSSTTTIVGSANVNIHDSSGNALNSTAGALNVSGTFTNPSIGTNGAATPASSTLVGGSDGTDLRPLKVSATGVLSVDGSASTQPISGTVTAVQATGTNLHTVVDNFPATQPISGTVTAKIQDGAGNNLTSQVNGGQRALDVGIDVAGVQIDPRDIRSLDSVSDSVEVLQATGTNLHTVVDSGTVASTQSGTWNINDISGTVSLPTGAATEATLATLSLNQGSTTSGEKGPLIQGAVTTAAPSYTTAQTSPLSLTTAGALRVDSSGSTQPVSGTVTVVQPTGTNLHAVLDSGTTTVTQATGTNLHTVVDSGSITVTQATGTNLHTVIDSGTVTANAGTGTFTISGTVTANAGTNLNTSALALDASAQSVIGTKGAGTAATNSQLTGGVFNSSAPALTNGQQAALQLDSSGNLKTTASATIAPNTAGSGSAAAATVSTVTTLTAPANAVGFILMNIDTSSANVRWSIGRTATTTLGQQLQPGRDTGFVPCGANVSLVAESGTQTYDIQWISSS